MNRWTDEDLEMFHDGTTPECDRAAIAADLLRDPALRKRLTRIVEADALAREALLGGSTGEREPLRFAWWRVAAATGAAAALAAAVLLLHPLGSRWTVTEHGRTASASGAPAARSEGLLLAVIPSRTVPAESAPASAPNISEERLRGLLDAGDIAGALALISQAEDRAAAFATLGDRLHSGDVARELLETLPVDRQVEACAAWAESPSLRYVAFDWLSRLSRLGDETARAAVARAHEAMADKPHLRSWLASYSLR